MIGRALLLVAVVATSAHATPWGERCKGRLAKLGKVTVGANPPAVPSPFRDLDAFGKVTLSAGALTATIGSDHSGNRYRGERGLYDKRNETWHSPYEDSRNGDPPKGTPDEEYHHRVTNNVILAELHGDGPRDVVKRALEACWQDVTVDEADPTLGWTTACTKDLATAQAGLAKAEPVFAAATCARDTYGAKCSKLEGGDPRWYVVLALAGGPKSPTTWVDDGDHHTSFADGGAQIWATPQISAAQFKALRAAFAAPLERCHRLLLANMYP